MDGINDAEDEDFILYSDNDEIPNLNKFNFQMFNKKYETWFVFFMRCSMKLQQLKKEAGRRQKWENGIKVTQKEQKVSQREQKCEPKGARGSQKWAKGNQKAAKGSQKGTKGEPRGNQNETKDDQNVSKNRPSKNVAKSIDSQILFGPFWEPFPIKNL